MATQTQYSTATQAYRNIDIKLEVLDYDFYVVDEISGLVETASFTVDADSDIRRTCNISMMLRDKFSNNQLYEAEYWNAGNPFWFDKYLRINLGIQDILTGEVVWNNQGIYLINSPSISYSAEDNTLSFEGVDLMAKLTGLRNGNLEGLDYVVPVGTKISTAMVDLIAQQGFNKYIILDPPQATVPYEIKISAGSTSYDVLSELRDINPNWEIFFDVDGVFYFQEIASNFTSETSPTPFVDNETLQQLYMNYELETSFEDVKNYVEVYGGTNATNHTTTAVVSDSQVNVTLDMSIADMTADYIYDFLITIGEATGTPVALTTKVDTIVIVDSASISVGTITLSSNPIKYTNWDYIVRVVKSVTGDLTLTYLGYKQPFGMAWVEDATSPFYVGEPVSSSTGNTETSPTDAEWSKPEFKRQVRIVLSGSDYDNIYSNDLAMERAKYELYLRSYKNDNISLEILPIYWLDVNQVIEFQLPNETKPDYWLIKEISTDFDVDGTQSITATRYYTATV
jgi:hypothetical protein